MKKPQYFDKYISIVKEHLKENEHIRKENYFYSLLSEIFERNKKSLKNVDFIVANPIKKREYIFEIFVLGSFKSEFNIIQKIADIVSEFYLEMKILPVIIPIRRNVLIKYYKFMLKRMQKGVIIYEGI